MLAQEPEGSKKENSHQASRTCPLPPSERAEIPLCPALLLPALSVFSPPNPLWLILTCRWLVPPSDSKKLYLSEHNQKITQHFLLLRTEQVEGARWLLCFSDPSLISDS